MCNIYIFTHTFTKKIVLQGMLIILMIAMIMVMTVIITIENNSNNNKNNNISYLLCENKMLCRWASVI